MAEVFLDAETEVGKEDMNQDMFTLDEGQVVLQWPERLSPEDYEDLKAWLNLISRKMGRSVTLGGEADRREGER